MDQHPTPSELAQRQLDAYNAHDLPGFLACYDPAVRIHDLPGGELRMEGHEAMAARYGPMFQRPDLHAELVGRLAMGDWVIDQERVRGALPDQVVHALAIYQVRAGKIAAVWFARGA
ncbi:MAG: nuclear transport factor 2 family protein [Planctomycetota bacterium]